MASNVTLISNMVVPPLAERSKDLEHESLCITSLTLQALALLFRPNFNIGARIKYIWVGLLPPLNLHSYIMIYEIQSASPELETPSSPLPKLKPARSWHP